MKSFLTFISACLFVFLSSCEKSNLEESKAQDKLELDKQYKKIEDLANSYDCVNAEDWKYIAIGSKACGGPQSYIAYSNQIEANVFEKMVKEYNEAERNFNVKHAVFSDCMMVMPPTRVECFDGKPKLIYKF